MPGPGMLAPASLWLHPASTFPRAAAGLTGFALVWTALQVLAWRISPLSHPSSDAAATAFTLVLQMLTYAVFMHPLTLSLNAWHQALLLTPQHHDKAMQPLLQDGADSASIAGSSNSWRKCWSSARRPFVRLGRLLFNPGSATGVWVRLACWNLLLFFADSLPRTLQYLYRLSWPYSLHLRQLIGPTLQQWIGPYWPLAAVHLDLAHPHRRDGLSAVPYLVPQRTSDSEVERRQRRHAGPSASRRLSGCGNSASMARPLAAVAVLAAVRLSHQPYLAVQPVAAAGLGESTHRGAAGGDEDSSSVYSARRPGCAG